MNKEFSRRKQFLKAFILAIIFNFVLFSWLPFLNKVRPITVVKKYPISLYRIEEVKARKPQSPAKTRNSPQPKRIEKLKKLELGKEEKLKGEENPLPATAPVKEIETVPAYEADLLSQESVLSSHARGEPTANEEKTSPIYDVSELDGTLQLVQYKLPNYPHLAQKTAVEAILILKLLISQEGLVEEIKLLESNVSDELGFFKEAKKAIKDWRFSKPKIAGEGVSVFYIFPLRFIAPGN